jgi:hypothetical protein
MEFPVPPTPYDDLIEEIKNKEEPKRGKLFKSSMEYYKESEFNCKFFYILKKYLNVEDENVYYFKDNCNKICHIKYMDNKVYIYHDFDNYQRFIDLNRKDRLTTKIWHFIQDKTKYRKNEFISYEDVIMLITVISYRYKHEHRILDYQFFNLSDILKNANDSGILSFNENKKFIYYILYNLYELLLEPEKDVLNINEYKQKSGEMIPYMNELIVKNILLYKLIYIKSIVKVDNIYNNNPFDFKFVYSIIRYQTDIDEYIQNMKKYKMNILK